MANGMYTTGSGTTNEYAYDGPKVAGMVRNVGERFAAPRLLEMLEKDAETLIGELNELREQLAPLMGPELVEKGVNGAPMPPAASQLGSQIARVSNAIYGARTLVRTIKAQLDL